MSHFEGFVSEDALAAAQDIVDEQRDTLSHYAIAFWGFVHQETKDFGFDAEPMHPDEALLIHAGSPGVDLAMLMGVLTKGKGRIAARPTFFVGIDNWL